MNFNLKQKFNAINRKISQDLKRAMLIFASTSLTLALFPTATIPLVIGVTVGLTTYVLAHLYELYSTKKKARREREKSMDEAIKTIHETVKDTNIKLTTQIDALKAEVSKLNTKVEAVKVDSSLLPSYQKEQRSKETQNFEIKSLVDLDTPMTIDPNDIFGNMPSFH